MTLKEFIKKYNGKHVDYDGVFGAQCMDLMHFYIDEVLMGEPSSAILRASSAKIAYETFDRPDLFEQIDNTPKGVPEEGDIMFWGIFPYGHVALFVEGDVNNFTSFDQNYPTGSECHEQNHTYKDVLGWLRFKGEETGSDCEQEITRLEKELDAKADEIIDIRESRDKWKREKKECEEDKASMEAEKQEHIESLQKSLSEMNSQLTNANRQIDTLTSSKNALELKIGVLEGKLTSADTIANKMDEIILDFGKKVVKLTNEKDILNAKYKKKIKDISFFEFIKLKLKG